MENYDVIVIGAGPAGLLIAKELSKKHKVLVLEKNKLGETNKSWVTYKDRWEKMGFPKSYITSGYDTWHFPMFVDGIATESIAKGPFVAFDAKRLLEYLIKEDKKLGITFKDKTPFEKYVKTNDGVLVNDKYSSKVIVDCGGNGSPILRNSNLINFEIYLNCYGAHVDFEDVQENYNVYHCHETKDKDVFEFLGVTRVAPKRLFLLYFRYSHELMDKTYYKKRFQHFVKQYGFSKGKVAEWKVFPYSSGELKSRSLDNVFLFGDAGMFAPGFAGMGFNEILRQHKVIAKHISKCLTTNKLSATDLFVPNEITNDLSNFFLKILSLTYFYIPPPIFNKVNAFLGKHPKYFTDIMRNEVTDKDSIAMLKSLIQVFDIEEFIKELDTKTLTILIKECLGLSKDIFEEEIHNLVFKHHKIRIKDMYS